MNPNEYIEGKVVSYREEMSAIGMRSDWQVGDEWLRTTLTDTWNKAREEAYAETIEQLKRRGEEAVKGLWYITEDDFLSLLTPNQKEI